MAKVGVLGARGRMGREVIRTVSIRVTRSTR